MLVVMVGIAVVGVVRCGSGLCWGVGGGWGGVKGRLAECNSRLMVQTTHTVYSRVNMPM